LIERDADPLRGRIFALEFGLQANAAVADDFDTCLTALDPIASYRERFLSSCDGYRGDGSSRFVSLYDVSHIVVSTVIANAWVCRSVAAKEQIDRRPIKSAMRA